MDISGTYRQISSENVEAYMEALGTVYHSAFKGTESRDGVSPYRLKNFFAYKRNKANLDRFTCVSLFHYKISLLFFRFFSLQIFRFASLEYFSLRSETKRSKIQVYFFTFFAFFHFFSLFFPLFFTLFMYRKWLRRKEGCENEVKDFFGNIDENRT
jgi:hypothetical protein